MRVGTWTKRLVAPIAVAVVAAACSIVTPVTGPGSIALPTVNAAQVGYQESEVFLTGLAHSYSPTAPLTGRAPASGARGRGRAGGRAGGPGVPRAAEARQ